MIVNFLYKFKKDAEVPKSLCILFDTITVTESVPPKDIYKMVGGVLLSKCILL